MCVGVAEVVATGCDSIENFAAETKTRQLQLAGLDVGVLNGD